MNTGPPAYPITACTNEFAHTTGQSGTTGEAVESSYDNSTGQLGISEGTTDSSHDAAPSSTRLAADPSYNTSSTQSEPRTGGTLGDANSPSYGGSENREQQSDIPSLSNTRFAQQSVTGVPSTDTQSTSGPPTSANQSNVETRGQVRGPVGGIGAVETSVGADPLSGAKPEEKFQGADRPAEEPSGEQVTAIRNEKEKHENIQVGNDPTGDDTGEGSTENKDLNDHSGEPLGTVDHGAPGQGKALGGVSEGYSKEKGTGELWVKSTGVAAHGGDFDAAKPGAGKEAGRKCFGYI